MTSFVPKRQLLTTKSKATHDIDVDKKKKDKHVDPIAIVPSDEQDSQKPRVGWEFRYRVSKYMDSLQASINADQERLKSDLHKVKQKRKVAKSSVSQTVDNEQLQAQQDAALDPELAQINDEGRKVGWAYRYRIRRKLDHLKAIEAETGVPFDLATLSGKREKKANATKPKAKAKTNLKKKNPTTPVPPSEQNKKADALQQAAAAAANRNVKHPKKTKKKVIKNTDSPSITRFISTLASKAKNSVCFLPGPNLLPFCSSENTKSTAPNKTVPRVKKLRMRTENRAKQFIHARITKLGAHDKATERRVDEQMKRLYKKPSYPPIQKPPPSSTVDSAAHSSKSHEHVEKVIAVDSKKAQNKKKNQIIGQEVPIKPKHASPPTTTTSEPVTPSVPLRSIAEVIKQEAATILKSDRKESQTPEEIQYEINETKEVVREQKLLKATPAAKSTSLNDTENATQT